MILAGNAAELNLALLEAPARILGSIQTAVTSENAASAVVPAEASDAPAALTAKGKIKKEKVKKERKPRDPNAPKPPLTPYFRYLQDSRAALPGGMKAGDVSQMISARWKSLDPADKQPYTDAYARDRVPYEAAMERYKQDLQDNKTVSLPTPNPASASVAKQISFDEESSSEDDSDTTSEDEDEAPPPPPPEVTMKTPKSEPKKKSSSTPMFNSINSAATSAPSSSPAKKRKSESIVASAADPVASEPSAKKPRGRPAKDPDAVTKKKAKRQSEV